MEITIKEKTIPITFSFRADIIFENIMDKSFECKSETEWITYLYSNIVAKDKSIDFEDFMDWLDENPTLLLDFINAYVERQKQLNLLTPKSNKEEIKTPSTGKDK